MTEAVLTVLRPAWLLVLRICPEVQPLLHNLDDNIRRYTEAVARRSRRSLPLRPMKEEMQDEGTRAALARHTPHAESSSSSAGAHAESS